MHSSVSLWAAIEDPLLLSAAFDASTGVSLQDQGKSIRPGQRLSSDRTCNCAGKSLKENIAHFITEPLGLNSTVEGGDVPFNKSAIAPNLTDAFLRNSDTVSGIIPFYDPSLVCLLSPFAFT